MKKLVKLVKPFKPENKKMVIIYAVESGSNGGCNVVAGCS